MKWVFQGFGIVPRSSSKERKMGYTSIRRGRSRETTKCYIFVTSRPSNEPRTIENPQNPIQSITSRPFLLFMASESFVIPIIRDHQLESRSQYLKPLRSYNLTFLIRNKLTLTAPSILSLQIVVQATLNQLQEIMVSASFFSDLV
jgi:hypothetical protein